MQRLLRALRQRLPRLRPEDLARLPLIGRLAAPLGRPALWQWRREPVARGAAVGAFFAFATPVAQIPAALLCALLFRLHLPTAALATFVNSPLTFGPVYYAAYLLGAWLLGLNPSAAEAEAAAASVSSGPGWGERALALLVGSLVFAVLAALTAYALVQGGWAWALWRRARRIRALRQADAQAG
ncbi:DUF2062 domain-containing protein [Piscinibacter sp. Jin2]|uniref:DUF2062 domain-containing protein n=2 Tax=Aquariibacter lacus TaxID=2801332 RepID=A0A9X1BPQ5_9BURK|nr:DUF2062 domain-containing protein [Piscinibacter lacus]